MSAKTNDKLAAGAISDPVGESLPETSSPYDTGDGGLVGMGGMGGMAGAAPFQSPEQLAQYNNMFSPAMPSSTGSNGSGYGFGGGFGGYGMMSNLPLGLHQAMGAGSAGGYGDMRGFPTSTPGASMLGTSPFDTSPNYGHYDSPIKTTTPDLHPLRSPGCETASKLLLTMRKGSAPSSAARPSASRPRPGNAKLFIHTIIHLGGHYKAYITAKTHRRRYDVGQFSTRREATDAMIQKEYELAQGFDGDVAVSLFGETEISMSPAPSKKRLLFRDVKPEPEEDEGGRIDALLPGKRLKALAELGGGEAVFSDPHGHSTRSGGRSIQRVEAELHDSASTPKQMRGVKCVSCVIGLKAGALLQCEHCDKAYHQPCLAYPDTLVWFILRLFSLSLSLSLSLHSRVQYKISPARFLFREVAVPRHACATLYSRPPATLYSRPLFAVAKVRTKPCCTCFGFVRSVAQWNTIQSMDAWRCPDCKVCSVCTIDYTQQPEIEPEMLLCEQCDTGVHLECTQHETPPTDFLCGNCTHK